MRSPLLLLFCVNILANCVPQTTAFSDDTAQPDHGQQSAQVTTGVGQTIPQRPAATAPSGPSAGPADAPTNPDSPDPDRRVVIVETELPIPSGDTVGPSCGRLSDCGNTHPTPNTDLLRDISETTPSGPFEPNAISN